MYSLAGMFDLWRMFEASVNSCFCRALRKNLLRVGRGSHVQPRAYESLGSLLPENLVSNPLTFSPETIVLRLVQMASVSSASRKIRRVCPEMSEDRSY